ncbi:transcriptional regulator BetI [Dongia sedimenti]|uniref:Transcriptional regulator BetI n=1 Tax=Dongia sedimenti TaxID=3064282 RepID=A0ABU0YV64_9PROT|nr:transcriptional regulator BetI [Rhodospirillaceae bacterium R-7]
MARDAIKEVRREQLIVATIDVIARKGFSELTLAEVAETAKLSTGIVNFYFKSKDVLLSATLAHMVGEYRRYWRANVAAATSPTAKLTAMLEGDFQRLVANRKTVTVWYAFWGETRWRPDFMTECQALSREFQAVASDLFRQLDTPDRDPMLIAKGFSAMSDGLWLDMLINPKETDRDTARRVVRAFLHGLYPEHFAADAAEASTSAA